MTRQARRKQLKDRRDPAKRTANSRHTESAGGGEESTPEPKSTVVPHGKARRIGHG